ncbi:MAG: tryptophan-rich sensory protein [Gammaproteobacteria bacterium]|nr:tryptophan-rich sensory protein [Gammaproteobacteria bacterium]
MYIQNKRYYSLFGWVGFLISVGYFIGLITKPSIDVWYHELQRSALTPPNFIFPVAWTLLYGLLGVYAWILWNKLHNVDETLILKILYTVQLVLNWSWSPVFFIYHAIGVALFILIMMNIITLIMMKLSWNHFRQLSFLIIPYLMWIMFATYLNLYIWLYN